MNNVGHLHLRADTMGGLDDWGPNFSLSSMRAGKRDVSPESPSRYPQTAEFVFCRRKRSGSERAWFVGLGVQPSRATLTRSWTGVGRGPSKARPYAVVVTVRSVANFFIVVVGCVRFQLVVRGSIILGPAYIFRPVNPFLFNQGRSFQYHRRRKYYTER